MFNVNELIREHDLAPEPMILQCIMDDILATKAHIDNVQLKKEFGMLEKNFRRRGKPFPYYFARAMYLDLHLKYPQPLVIALTDAMDITDTINDRTTQHNQ